MITDVDFTSDGTRCDAWLYRPETEGPEALPIIVMAHGLGATKKMRLDAYAERFSAAGYPCLVFDYRHFGASEGEPRQLLSVKRQLQDWEAAVAFARNLPGIDPDRVVVWGTSFGGGHALSMAARDRRLAAAIAQCPFTDGVASTLAINPLTSTRLTFAAIRDVLRGLRKRPPVYLPDAGAPGTTAFMTAPDALPGMTAIAERTDDFDNRLTARSAFSVLGYGPGRRAKKIACPTYVALCDPDSVAPDKTARRQLGRSPKVEIHTYPTGHFGIYLDEQFEHAVRDYLGFLGRQVPLPANPSAA